METPLFSIIVPIYNVEKYLEQCINSILEQKLNNYEVLLIDDGSTDNSAKICDNFISNNSNVKVIHKRNEGLVSARNIGILEAKGQYIAYVDGDDWVATDWLEKINNALITYNYPDIINFNAYKSYNNKNEILKTSNFLGNYDKEMINKTIIPNMIYYGKKKFYSFGILPAVWSKVFKRDLLLKNQCKDLNITFGEDFACSYNCLIDAQSFVGINDALYFYRQNSNSMTKAYDKKRFDKLDCLFRYIDIHLLKYDEIQEQIELYKIFCVLYAILNEAKNNKSIIECSLNCQRLMNQYNFNKLLINKKIKNMGLFWKIFYNLLKKKCYCILMTFCKIVINIKYKYKD